MTDRCKNITLPQTSFAGGKKSSHLGQAHFYRPQTKFGARLCFTPDILFNGGGGGGEGGSTTPPSPDSEADNPPVETF